MFCWSSTTSFHIQVSGFPHMAGSYMLSGWKSPTGTISEFTWPHSVSSMAPSLAFQYLSPEQSRLLVTPWPTPLGLQPLLILPP